MCSWWKFIVAKTKKWSRKIQSMPHSFSPTNLKEFVWNILCRCWGSAHRRKCWCGNVRRLMGQMARCRGHCWHWPAVHLGSAREVRSGHWLMNPVDELLLLWSLLVGKWCGGCRLATSSRGWQTNLHGDDVTQLFRVHFFGSLKLFRFFHIKFLKYFELNQFRYDFLKGNI